MQTRRGLFIRLLRGALYLLYLFVVVVALLEVGLRIVTPAGLKARIEMNQLARDKRQTQASAWEAGNMRFAPGSSGSIIHQEYNVPATHDRLGFRNPCFDFSNKIKTILVGDSFVYGVGVADQDTLGCALVRSGQAGAYTVGAPGMGFAQYLQALEKNAAGLKAAAGNEPALVSIVAFLGNDYEALTAGPPAETPAAPMQMAAHRSPLAKVADDVNAFVVKNPVVSNSYSIQGLKLLAQRLMKLGDTGPFVLNYNGSSLYKKITPPATDKVAEYLAWFSGRVEAAGFSMGPIYLLPEPAEISPERLRRDAGVSGFSAAAIDVNHKYAAMSSACASARLRCIDLRPALNEADYYVSDNHLRPSGVTAIARVISGDLASRR